MTDNGTQYTGQAFQQFVDDWDIKHVTSSPRFPQSNGFIERHVRTIKAIVTKCIADKEDLQRALMNVRATPISTDLPSPAEMLLGKPISTMLPSRSEPGKEEQRKALERRCAHMKDSHDRHAVKSELPPLQPGQQVRIRNTDSQLWQPGVVLEVLNNNSYTVESWNGAIVRRTRSHIRAAERCDRTKQVRFDLPPRANPPAKPAVTTETPAASIRRVQPDRHHTGRPPNPKERAETMQKTPSDSRRTRSGRIVKTPNRYGRE